MNIKGIDIKLPKDLKLNPLQDKTLKSFFNLNGDGFVKKQVTSVDVDTRINWLRRRGNVSGLTPIDNGLLFRPSLPEGMPDNANVNRLSEYDMKKKIDEKMAEIKTKFEAKSNELHEKMHQQTKDREAIMAQNRIDMLNKKSQIKESEKKDSAKSTKKTKKS